jgi:hypothetical protein
VAEKVKTAQERRKRSQTISKYVQERALGFCEVCGYAAPMSHADDVRDHCKRKYIEPARRRGDQFVVIRAGDVHGDMGYRARCHGQGKNWFKYGAAKSYF